MPDECQGKDAALATIPSDSSDGGLTLLRSETVEVLWRVEAQLEDTSAMQCHCDLGELG